MKTLNDYCEGKRNTVDLFSGWYSAEMGMLNGIPTLSKSVGDMTPLISLTNDSVDVFGEFNELIQRDDVLLHIPRRKQPGVLFYRNGRWNRTEMGNLTLPEIAEVVTANAFDEFFTHACGEGFDPKAKAWWHLKHGQVDRILAGTAVWHDVLDWMHVIHLMLGHDMDKIYYSYEEYGATLQSELLHPYWQNLT